MSDQLARQVWCLLYLSGVLPVIGHEPKFKSPLARGYNVEHGCGAARLATLNVLSAARNHPGSQPIDPATIAF
jgi:hypothetical protein